MYVCIGVAQSKAPSSEGCDWIEHRAAPSTHPCHFFAWHPVPWWCTAAPVNLCAALPSPGASTAHCSSHLAREDQLLVLCACLDAQSAQPCPSPALSGARCDQPWAPLHKQECIRSDWDGADFLYGTSMRCHTWSLCLKQWYLRHQSVLHSFPIPQIRKD